MGTREVQLWERWRIPFFVDVKGPGGSSNVQKERETVMTPDLTNSRNRNNTTYRQHSILQYYYCQYYS